jgi:uncharacterized membrane protein
MAKITKHLKRLDNLWSINMGELTNMKQITALLAVVFVAVCSFASVFALNNVSDSSDLSVEYVKINGDEYESGDSLKVDLNEKISIRVKLQAVADVSNVQVGARLIGYEYSDRESVSDVSRTFDLNAGDTEYVDLEVAVPLRAEKDSYELRIDVDGRKVNYEYKSFTVRVAGPRSAVWVKDVIFSPNDAVQAGRSVLVSARLENIGERDLDEVKVSASIPSLGVVGATYLDELDGEKVSGRGERKSSEEVLLRIPACAKPGVYDVVVQATFDEYEVTKVTRQLQVIAGDACPLASAPTASERTVISAPSLVDVVSGVSGSSVPIVIQNMGSQAKSYTITVVGADDWAVTKVSDKNPIVSGGESKVVPVSIAAKPGTVAGVKTFAIEVATESGKQQILVSANVTAQQDTLKTVLQIGVIVLVVILVILGLVVAFTKMRNNDDDDIDNKGQAYY